MPGASSLSSVVSGLVRAQVGSSVPSSVQEDEVDRYVQELILKEAKQKAERYSNLGIQAYLPPSTGNAAKTDKRFLSQIIRRTDDHNKTILKAKAQAAQEVRAEREEAERLDQKRRAEEAVLAEKERRSRGESSRGWDRDWDHGKDRSRRKRRREAEGEEDSPRNSEKRRRRGHSHSEDDRPRRSSRRRSDDEDRPHRSSRRRTHSDEEQDRDKSHRSSRRSKRSHRSRSPRRRSESPPPPPPIPAPSTLPSKMDKYFEQSYDPRLDVEPLPLPTIPATGLISDAEFEGWDAMLQLIKFRRQDKEDKKALERVGIPAKRSKSGAIVADRPEVEAGHSIMNIEYAKKGSVREWDMGKEGF
ncbi:hypothetical protein BJ322DRAFT_716365 [Thelephora terrestris]|uniref:Uncharacterized protein n=1 Tax=Thelephora terrestris TaxID=56493 RepID=A0A9P6HJK0_9AGAM|nr:hypothetical protein BJ322DRAFT_716365 [Thelephora terrestris]